MRRNYAPYLMRPIVKGCILILFAGIFVGSVVSIQYIQLGLGVYSSHLLGTVFQILC